jgi:hypothetical protein
MKKLVIVFATLMLPSFTISAEKAYYSGKVHTVTNIVLSESLPASPTPAPCTCSCGRNCDGSCTANFSGCGLGDGFRCLLDCCQAAPNPRPDECGGGIRPEE